MNKTRIADPQAERRLFMRRSAIVFAFVLVLAAILAGQLVNLQVVRHAHYATLSDGNRMRLEPVPPARGMIHDRNGVVLARNLPSFTLELIPEQVEDIDETLRELSALVNVREQDLARFQRQLQRQRRFEPVPVRFQLSEEEVARFALNRHRFAGVDIRATLSRRYPLGELGAHVIGYVGAISEADLQRLDTLRYRATTHTGKTGVERRYENVLHGTPGYRRVETNAEGRILRVLEYDPPAAGRDIYLTLDHRVQQAAEDALGDNSGAVVALDPRNGDVLALASRPAFDPNGFVDGIEQAKYQALEQHGQLPMFNRALRGRYPPGSTVKPFLAMAALEYEAEIASNEIDCQGAYTLPGGARRYRDWRREGHGRVGLHRAVVESCDVYFYQLAHELGIDRMHAFLHAAGFGRVTGIDLNGELAGLVPSREWKRETMNQAWYPGETIITGIGQGYLLSTPLQLAHLTSVLATRGQAYPPRVLMGTATGSGDDIEPPGANERVQVDVTEPAHWEAAIRAMVDVVHGARGTARSIGTGIPYRIAGKTGTAQVFTLTQDDEARLDPEDVSAHLRDHAMFIAFAPADDPSIAVAVVVEHGGGGGGVAAPVARRVIDAWMNDAGNEGGTDGG